MKTMDEVLQNGQRWELLYERKADETYRTVHRVDDHYIVKTFEWPVSIRCHRRPWRNEDDCLRRLAGNGAPRTLGWCEQRKGPKRIVYLVKEYVEGICMNRVLTEEIPELARLMARIHRAKIITNDAYPANFLRRQDGQLVFLDFGKALAMPVGGWLLDFQIGRDCAGLYRRVFLWNHDAWTAFLSYYFCELPASRLRQRRIQAAISTFVFLRMLRKYLQRKPIRS